MGASVMGGGVVQNPVFAAIDLLSNPEELKRQYDSFAKMKAEAETLKAAAVKTKQEADTYAANVKQRADALLAKADEATRKSENLINKSQGLIDMAGTAQKNLEKDRQAFVDFSNQQAQMIDQVKASLAQKEADLASKEQNLSQREAILKQAQEVHTAKAIQTENLRKAVNERIAQMQSLASV